MTLACEICIWTQSTKKLVSCFGQWDDLMAKGELAGASIAIMRCYETDGINILSIWVTIWVSLRVETHLQKSFRDVNTIWSQVLKLNRSCIMLFLELQQVYLSMAKMIRSPNPSHGLYFWMWPLHAKFALGLTDPKKLVYGLVQWDDLLDMDKLCRGIPSYYARVWWNWHLFYLSYHLGIMASWKSLAKGI